MPNIETIEYTLPAFWASALINGDYSGLSDYSGNPDDDAQVHAFEQYMLEQYGSCGCIDCSTVEFFTPFHDAHGVLACDCLVYTFDITPWEPTT